MKTIVVKKKELDFKEYVKRSAKEEDFTTLITESCIVTDEEGNILIVYKELDFDDKEILWALNRIKYSTGMRTEGLKSTSRIFGYSPRLEVRQDYCTSTSLAREQPTEHAIVCKYGIQIAGLYSEFTPETAEHHKKLMKEKVLDEWAIKDTPFTSGIINKNNPLKYHFDSGNFKGVYSCMAVFKSKIKGGYLSIPEYNIGVELKHNSVFMFDGQSILHGVTPIEKQANDAFRYSIVYYSLSRVWECLPLDQELARIRNRKSEREQKRLDRLMGKEVDDSSLTRRDGSKVNTKTLK